MRRRLSSKQNGSKMPKKDNTEALAAFYQGVLENLNMIHSADTAVESKTNALLAADLVVVTIVLNKVKEWNNLAILGLVLLGLSATMALVGVWVKTYRTAAVSVKENPEYIELGSQDLVLQLISDAEGSIDVVAKNLEFKTILYKSVVVLLVLGAICSFASFYIKVVKV